MAKIIILGSGGFGLSIAIMCANAGHDVTVWSKFRDEIDAIERTGELKAKTSLSSAYLLPSAAAFAKRRRSISSPRALS